MKRLIGAILSVLCILQTVAPVMAAEMPAAIVEKPVQQYSEETTSTEEITLPEEEQLQDTTSASQEEVEALPEEPETTTEEPETEPEEETQQPELSETPGEWAMEAVLFCVENGIVNGSNLRLNDYATRAELAAMLTRLLGVEQQADLSTYVDVASEDWYYEALAQAVAAGIVTGSGNQLKPNDRVTRQEAMVMLSRCFGIPGGDTARLNEYTDSFTIDVWAAESVAGLVTEGYVSGYGNEMRAQTGMNRQELMRLMYDMAGGILTEQPETETVLDHSIVYQGTQLQNVTVNGNLYLGGAGEEVVELDNVQVTGSIVCYAGQVVLTNGTTAQQVVVSGNNVNLKTEDGAKIAVLGRNAQLSGGGTVETTQNVTLLGGTYEMVTVEKGTVTVQAAAQVQQAELWAASSCVTGSGLVKQAILHNAKATVETANTETSMAVDTRFQQMQISAVRPANDAKPGQQTIYTEVQFTNTGESDQPLLCDLTWYVDGVAQKRLWQVPMAEGTKISYGYWAMFTPPVAPTRTVTLQVTCGQETRTLSQTVKQIPEVVDTINVEATVRWTTNLYRTEYLSGYIKSVPAGTKVIYYDYVGQSTAAIRLPDGTSGWVNWSSISISNKNYVQKDDYQTSTKEYFVNSKNYSSKTEYLVWVSLLKERVNVFQGSQGNWKLVKSFPCSSGKNTTPTNGGVFAYQYRQNYWDFGYYYVKKPMIFNGGHAFHTRTYIKSTGGLLDPTMQGTVSQGCIRMYDADVDWLWDNLPFQSTVVVY